MLSIGERLRIFREFYGYSQKTVGELIGMSDRSIRRIESGDMKPSKEFLNKIARIYEIEQNFITLANKNGSRTGIYNIPYYRRILIDIRRMFMAGGNFSPISLKEEKYEKIRYLITELVNSLTKEIQNTYEFESLFIFNTIEEIEKKHEYSFEEYMDECYDFIKNTGLRIKDIERERQKL